MPPSLRTEVPLAPYTTLGVGGNARYFVEVSTKEEVRDILIWAREQDVRWYMLGGGSNVLISDQGIDGIVIRYKNTEVVYEPESNGEIVVTVGAGKVLDEFISETVERGLWGLENLSAIPGTVGAVPIQNVGAYGVEAKDVVSHVTVYDAEHDVVRVMSTSECRFGYRDSIFKQIAGKYLVILAVTFTLSVERSPRLTYTDLARFPWNTSEPNILDIRNAIIKIRGEKFPDWNVVGTAGSFFKNPIISEKIFTELRSRYPGLPGYPTGDGLVKVSLGWILDVVCNLKGYTRGTVGLYKAQALVLVCAKGTSSSEIEIFVTSIIERVYEATGIRVEREVTTLT